MVTPNSLPQFRDFLLVKDPEIFKAFSERDDMILDPNENGEYIFMIGKASEYYTQEQKEKLFSYWNEFIVSPTHQP